MHCFCWLSVSLFFSDLDPVFTRTNAYTTHTHFSSPADLKQNCSAFILLEIVPIVPSSPWCVTICWNQWGPEIGIILSTVYSPSRSAFAHAWMRKSDCLRKKGVSTSVKGGCWVPAVFVNRPAIAVAPLHISSLPYLSASCFCFRVTTQKHTHIIAQWVHDTMRYTANAHRKDSPCATCAKVDSLKTMLHHRSRHNHSTFKDLGLKDRKAAQCINTAVSQLYSQAV